MLGGDRCRVRLLWLLLLALGMVLMLVLIGGDNSLTVGLPGEGHRSSNSISLAEIGSTAPTSQAGAPSMATTVFK